VESAVAENRFSLMPGRTLRLRWLGSRVAYRDAHALQRALWAAGPGADDWLLLLEHQSVFTAGVRAKPEHMLVDPAAVGAELLWVDRGGDITYHGPGQLVGYPILNLAEIRRDVAWYVRNLEEAMMGATADFGIATRRVSGCTGVWTDVPISVVPASSDSVSATPSSSTPSSSTEEQPPEEQKLAAIGVRLSRWVTSHGFAYNVSTDLRYFDLIVPCGIAGKRATSLEQRLDRRVEISEVAPRIVERLGKLFGLAMRDSDRAELDELLQAREEHPAAVTS